MHVSLTMMQLDTAGTLEWILLLSNSALHSTESSGRDKQFRTNEMIPAPINSLSLDMKSAERLDKRSRWRAMMVMVHQVLTAWSNLPSTITRLDSRFLFSAQRKNNAYLQIGLPPPSLKAITTEEVGNLVSIVNNMFPASSQLSLAEINALESN